VGNARDLCVSCSEVLISGDAVFSS